MGWTVLGHGMATFTPPIYHPQDPDQAARVEEVEKLLNQASHVPQPDEVQAWLDDLVRICIRHDLCIKGTHDGEVELLRTNDAWSGYSASVRGGSVTIHEAGFGDIVSLDPSELTAHQRLVILGGGLGPPPAAANEKPSP